MSETPLRTDAEARADRLDAASLCELFQRTAAERGSGVALRSADAVTVLTWSQYADEVRRVAAGLSALGVTRGGTVALMMANRPEFHVVDAAVLHLGAASFSIYTTFTEEVVAHLLANSGATVAVCETRFLETLVAARRSSALTTVVCLDGGDPRSITLDELKDSAEDDFDFDATWRAVDRGDVATLIYTSGTTGAPKGVELTHGNILADLRATAAVLEVRPGDRAISSLPMAHAAERWATHYQGLAYGLDVTSVEDLKTLPIVLGQVRPHIWGSVPRVWEKLHAALIGALDAEPDPASRAVVSRAVDVGLACVRAQQEALRGEGDGPGADLLADWDSAERHVFSRLRGRVGLDAVRWAAVGSAPTPPPVLEFFAAIRVPICELWGMSELTCAATCNSPGDGLLGSVGRPLPGVDIRLATDGEVEVRGPIVMRGYRNEAEQTAQTMTVDGWLKTGDIGRFDGEFLSIVDRKKEIIINASGKNMSPANIESALKGASRLIAHAVAIGDQKPYVTALITLDAESVSSWAATAGIEDGDAACIAYDPRLVDAIEQAVAKANESLARVEQIRRFRVVAETWEPGSDLLTPTMKLKRRGIAARYAPEIDELYAP